MDFLGIGLPEIILILIIAAVVIGPKRLPEVAVQLARVIRQLRGSCRLRPGAGRRGRGARGHRPLRASRVAVGDVSAASPPRWTR